MQRGASSFIGEVNELRAFRRSVIPTILAHVPSISDADEERLNAINLFDEATDWGDLAIRTCACGKAIADYYSYVDHLVAVFGGESHLGG